MSPKGVLENASSVGVAIIVWVSTGVITAIGALCYAELGVTIPKSGGDYSYVKDIFGGLAGWDKCFDTVDMGLETITLFVFWLFPFTVNQSKFVKNVHCNFPRVWDTFTLLFFFVSHPVGHENIWHFICFKKVWKWWEMTSIKQLASNFLSIHILFIGIWIQTHFTPPWFTLCFVCMMRQSSLKELHSRLSQDFCN